MSDQQQVVDARRKAFDGIFHDYPDNAFDVIELSKHRYVSVEDDPRGEVWCKGHQTVPGACRYLQDQMTGGYKPLFIVDLDSAEKIELDLKAVVVPKSMGAVVIPMSRAEAGSVRNVLDGAAPDQQDYRAGEKVAARITSALS